MSTRRVRGATSSVTAADAAVAAAAAVPANSNSKEQGRTRWRIGISREPGAMIGQRPAKGNPRGRRSRSVRA
ncbi:hypothetical protein GCM10027564_13960 [Luteimonas notoginsengisoli]